MTTLPPAGVITYSPVTDYHVWAIARDWLLGKGWVRDGDDMGAWIPPGGTSGDAVTFSMAFATQVARDGWTWDGPVAQPY